MPFLQTLDTWWAKESLLSNTTSKHFFFSTTLRATLFTETFGYTIPLWELTQNHITLDFCKLRFIYYPVPNHSPTATEKSSKQSKQSSTEKSKLKKLSIDNLSFTTLQTCSDTLFGCLQGVYWVRQHWEELKPHVETLAKSMSDYVNFYLNNLLWAKGFIY